MGRLKSLLAIVTGGILALAATNAGAPAHAAGYSFTEVYSGSGSLGAAINDNGLVALITGGDSLITTNGQTSTVIAGPGSQNHLDPLNPSDLQQVLSLNNNGFVAFRGYGSDGTHAVLASNGSTTYKIAADLQDGGSFYSIAQAAMSINDSGMVAFGAQQTSTSGGRAFVGNGGVPVQINDRSAGVPAINSSGAVAYVNHDTSTVEIQSGTQLSSLPNPGTIFSMPAINGYGKVAFLALAGSVPKLVIGDGISPATVVDLSQYTTLGSGYVFDGGLYSECAINNQGIVAFEAGMGLAIPPSFTNTLGIYVGPNPTSDKVIGMGDTLQGATVTWLDFSRGGFNNDGQIAFWARLSNGAEGLFVATPIPEPSTLVLLVAGATGVLGYNGGWRKRAA